MKLHDAPAPGWYPDPEARGRLRWWEGTDWTDSRRAVPTDIDVLGGSESQVEAAPSSVGMPRFDVVKTRTAADDTIFQVRQAAREEIERAADLFSQRARDAVERGRSVAAQYVALVLRWVRIIVVGGAILVVVWFVLQFLAQAAFLGWLGDRIDNLTS